MPIAALWNRRVYAIALALPCASSALLGACGASAPETATPEHTVIALSRALSDGKHEEAYALMSDDFRRRVSLEQWKQSLADNAEEVLETSSALAKARGPYAKVVVVPYGDRELHLLESDGRWVVTTDVTGFYDQSTPRAAVHAFVRALTRKRYDVLLRLCPNAEKDGATADTLKAAWSGRARDDIDRMLTGLRAAQNDPIEVTGNRATMPYGGRMQMQLVREDGLWKVESAE
jgi:hypothetical protein